MNRSTEAHHIHLARLVFAERRNIQRSIEKDAERRASQREYFAAAVVTEYIGARRQRRSRTRDKRILP